MKALTPLLHTHAHTHPLLIKITESSTCQSFSLSRHSFKGRTEKENTINDGRETREGNSTKKGGGDGKRRKGEKVGQFIHVWAAQTVDNGTEVDGRPTTAHGLTTRWLSHAMAPECRPCFREKPENLSIYPFFPFLWIVTVERGAFFEPKTFHANTCDLRQLSSRQDWFGPSPTTRTFWLRICLLAVSLHIFRYTCSHSQNPPGSIRNVTTTSFLHHIQKEEFAYF